MWPRTVTGRCRLVLALSPVIVPFYLLISILACVFYAVEEFVLAVMESLAHDWRFWYREVYRPARYGSVHDPE